MAAHVADWKKGELKELVDLVSKHKVIGIVNISGIPAPSIQKMRKNLHGSVTVRSAKNTLIGKSLDEADKKLKGVSGLKENISGQAAILATDMNPFKLSAQIKKTRSMAPAKGGEVLDHDIVIKAGETPFKPGPIVGELQKVGIPAAIQEGKVVIKSDKTIVPAGKKIPKDVAQMLARLEIFPIEIGMNLQAVYEDGTIYKPNVLDIDIDQFMGRMRQASSFAFNLAMEAGWTNELTIRPLIGKAYRNAHALALDRGIITNDNIKDLLAKAHVNMLALKKITT